MKEGAPFDLWGEGILTIMLSSGAWRFFFFLLRSAGSEPRLRLNPDSSASSRGGGFGWFAASRPSPIVCGRDENSLERDLFFFLGDSMAGERCGASGTARDQRLALKKERRTRTGGMITYPTRLLHQLSVRISGPWQARGRERQS